MTALILTTIAIAILSAWYDKQVIADGYEIMHTPGWIARALFVSIAALLFGHPWMVLGLWGLFSAVFRYSLNRWRGFDWRYVSPSNWYDYGFLVLSGAWQWKPSSWTWSNWRGFMRHAHWSNYELEDIYVKQVRRAGTLAYIVEVVAFVVVAYICG